MKLMKKLAKKGDLFKISGIIAGFILVQAIIIFAVSPIIVDSYLHSERHFDPYPEIDTIFTPNFSIENFNKITNGMSIKQVTDLIGAPLEKQNISITIEFPQNPEYVPPRGGTVCWNYSHDGKVSPKADFSWYQYQVCFDKDQVYLKSAVEHMD